jgi:hypothetical protein
VMPMLMISLFKNFAWRPIWRHLPTLLKQHQVNSSKSSFTVRREHSPAELEHSFQTNFKMHSSYQHKPYDSLENSRFWIARPRVHEPNQYHSPFMSWLIRERPVAASWAWTFRDADGDATWCGLW